MTPDTEENDELRLPQVNPAALTSVFSRAHDLP